MPTASQQRFPYSTGGGSLYFMRELSLIFFHFVHTDFRLWYKIAKLSASVTLWARITAQLCPLLYIIHPNLNLLIIFSTVVKRLPRCHCGRNIFQKSGRKIWYFGNMNPSKRQQSSKFTGEKEALISFAWALCSYPLFEVQPALGLSQLINSAPSRGLLPHCYSNGPL